jgi:DNA-binding NtrC family response regulator
MNANILLVDDTVEIRLLAGGILRQKGYTTQEAASGAALQALIQTPGHTVPDLVLLDLRLEDTTGIDLLPEIRHAWPRAEVIIVTGYATIEAAVTATKLGAYGFIEKPFDGNTLTLTVQRALERRTLREQADSLRKVVSTLSAKVAPVFQSLPMKDVMRMVERVAASESPVLIVGESGVGKEVVAEMVHHLSPRAQGPWVKVNCLELAPDRMEGELFGVEKGHASLPDGHPGFCRLAEGGTLLLDGLTDLTLEMQGKLLGVLQEGSARAVGAVAPYRIGCRILAITNRPVPESIRSGKLREDVFYRISAITITVPPLRQRKEDILPLANAFLQRSSAQANRSLTGFSERAGALLRGFDWPGNVRQLQNEIQRAVLMANGTQIQAEDLTIAPQTTGDETEFGLMEALERKAILQALGATGGSVPEAARRLGIGRQTLLIKMKAYRIESVSGKHE